MKKQVMVGMAIVVLLAVFAAAAIQYKAKMADDLGDAAFENASLLVRDYSPAKGSADARVTLVEFFDPACETCRAFYPLVEGLMAAHPGRVRLVLRYTPFHDGSDGVVKMLEAARKQDLYWEALEVTFASQPAWTQHHRALPEKLWPYLGRVGLDIEKAKRDMHGGEITDRIRQDLSDARQLQVTKTPGYFVNGRPLVQFGYEELQRLVESEVRRQYPD
jgi:protein-disulfide isomerase